MMNGKQLILVWIIIINFIFITIVLAQPDLRIEGIFIDKKKESSAIVNGAIVQKGDKIGEIEVMEIDEDSIKFRYGKEIFIKKLEEKIKNSEQETKNKEEQQIGFGTYKDIKHYEKAMELYKLGNVLKGRNNEKAFNVFNEALEEARGSLRYDYVTKEMKSQLDSIIEEVREYQVNYKRSKDKFYSSDKAVEYINKSRRAGSKDEAIAYLKSALDYKFWALDNVIDEKEKKIIEILIEDIKKEIKYYDSLPDEHWNYFKR